MNSINRAFNTVCKSIEKNAWLGVVLAVITVMLLWLVAVILNRTTVRPYSGSFIESFVQNSSSKISANLIVKKDADTKDAFYASVYDDLFNQSVNNVYEVGELINKYPDISNQTIALDVEAGTGAYMNAFIQNGITNVTGIESSADMVAQAKKTYPGMNIVKGNPTVVSAFKPDSFTLVSVLNYEVYHIPNTEQLFSNIYAWLKPGGYFVLHLVDPRKFNAASMLGGENATANPTRNGAQSAVKFNDFEYNSDVQVFPNDMVQYMEVFTDDTGKVRKNVRNFKLPLPHEFIALATGVGFNMLGQIDLVKAEKEYQYFYLFYKPAN